MIYSLDSINLALPELLKSFIVGTFYDLVAESYFVLPLVLYIIVAPSFLKKTHFRRFVFFTLFAVMQLIILINSISEWFFWDEFQVRYNFIAVDYLVYTTEVLNNIWQSYPVEILIPLLIIIDLVIVYFCRKIILNSIMADYSIGRKLKKGSCYFAVALLSFVLVNGSAGNISSNKYNSELTGNGFYTLFEAFWSNVINYNEFYLTADNNQNFQYLKKILATPNSEFTGNAVTDISRQITYSGQPQKYNVILITVESLSADYLAHFGSERDITPNLDSLAEQSIFATRYFATGTRTVRGLEAITLSVPPTPGASIVRRKNNENLYNIGTLYQNLGYDLKFIYGGDGFFDNMNYFFANNGFQIVDKKSFSDQEITFGNAWGVCDEDLFSKTLKEADLSAAQGHNFFSFVLTTSNHRPFTYPAGRIDIKEGRHGAVKYTDYAIGKLIRDAQKKSWFKNTIFVITADHCANSAGKTELPIEKYHIPLIIYAPNILLPQKVENFVSQIDLAPTLPALMNQSYNSKFWGENILTNSQNRVFISNFQKIGYLKQNKMVVLDVKKQKSFYSVDNLNLQMSRIDSSKSINNLTNEAISFYQSAFFAFEHNGLKNLQPKLANNNSKSP